MVVSPDRLRRAGTPVRVVHVHVLIVRQRGRGVGVVGQHLRDRWQTLWSGLQEAFDEGALGAIARGWDEAHTAGMPVA